MNKEFIFQTLLIQNYKSVLGGKTSSKETSKNSKTNENRLCLLNPRQVGLGRLAAGASPVKIDEQKCKLILLTINIYEISYQMDTYTNYNKLLWLNGTLV